MSKSKKKRKGTGNSKAPVVPVKKNVMVDGYVRKTIPPNKTVEKKVKSKRKIPAIVWLFLIILVWAAIFWYSGVFSKKATHQTRVDSTAIPSVQAKKDSVVAVSKPAELLKVIPKKLPPKKVAPEPELVTTSNGCKCHGWYLF